MDPTIQILISSPVLSEANALRDIVASIRPPALVLANFEVGGTGISRQIDFVVITTKRAELLEIKGLTAPVKGGLNGPWLLETSPGSFEPYIGPNPWEQARDAKLALSDAMHEFAKRRPEIPRPAQGKFFKQFDASVTIYPTIMPGSRLPKGNAKAWIRSFPDTLQGLESRPLPEATTWSLEHWQRFATEYLGLMPVTLASAIDATVFTSDQALRAYLGRLASTTIPPMLTPGDGEMTGKNLLDRLSGSGDMLLLGRSGLGKSFHLDHLRRRCDGNEVPILLYAGHYQRDLNRAIHKTTGPFTRLTPAELLNAAWRISTRPLLIADGWNDCPEPLQKHLADDLAAFQTRYGARLIVAAQRIPDLPLFGQFSKVELAPLRSDDKTAIFAHYAGKPDASIAPQSCEPFSTAFDLRVAGRCGRNGVLPETRAQLYDLYLRERMPSVTARSILRRLAWFMGEEFKPVLTLEEYERLAEKFAGELGAPICHIDEILTSGILNTDGNVVAFDHDLLKDYFRAKHLIQTTEERHLGTLVMEPKYSGLGEFIVPWLTEPGAIQYLLAKTGADLLSAAFRGRLGTIAKRLVRERCQAILQLCRDRLVDITIDVSVGALDDGKRYIASVRMPDHHCALDQEATLCSVIACNLDDATLQAQFLDLLQIGEYALTEASKRTGRELRFKPLAVWHKLIHFSIWSSGSPTHPLLLICHCLRGESMWAHGKPTPSPIREVLLQQVRQNRAGMLPLLLLMFDLRYHDSVDANDILTIVRQAWDTGLSMLRTEALDFLHSNVRAIHCAGERAEAATIDLLESFDVSNDIFLSTSWLEIRSCFDGFDTGITCDDALNEFRRILLMEQSGDDPLYELARERDPSATYSEYLARSASSSLGKVFEDVFQNVYCEAYEQLTAPEKESLLSLALQRTDVGLFSTWYLEQLISVGDLSKASDILLRYGSRIMTDTMSRQDSVAMYVIAHVAWARIATTPIPYHGSDAPGHRAWAIIGEAVFWMNRPDSASFKERASALFEDLLAMPAELPCVLRELAHSHKGMGHAPVLLQLFNEYPEGLRRALHECLKCDGCFVNVFPGGEFHSGQTFEWVISCLGDVGNRETVALLRDFSRSPTYGGAAIRAIEKIERKEALAHVR